MPTLHVHPVENFEYYKNHYAEFRKINQLLAGQKRVDLITRISDNNNMMMRKELMNILTNYKPSITNISKKEQSTYLKLVKQQLSPEILELIIDITVQFDTEILESLEGTDRYNNYLKLCAILDGDSV